jgi:hypothetical protein
VERKEGRARGKSSRPRKNVAPSPCLPRFHRIPSFPFSLVARETVLAPPPTEHLLFLSFSLSATAFRALRVNCVYFLLYPARTLRIATFFQRRACTSLPEKPRPFNLSSLVVSPKLTPSGNHVADLQLALQNLSRC